MDDRLKMEDIFYKTCKECSRDKVKATNELRKEQKKRIQPMQIHRLKPLKLHVLLYLQHVNILICCNYNAFD